ncbi:MAG: GFA family protein [Phenylobacterium sp.]|uniref:GFA family protein n=1 Tax=Phenylobacterium sp. TaxID=1871053 RepID=UPI0027343FC0|nr:GFA family protein [Phenylobacterium sp.]MDP3176228.1 GFA family protein [Phenylobacterium sp.]
MAWTGGCQCGAVRFRVEGELGRASICHCRMCQKATGGPFGAFVTVKRDDLTWTRAEPQRFQSSNIVRRGFCAACGTPLTFETDRSTDLSIFAFDRVGEITPVIQLEPERSPAWVAHLAELPVEVAPPGYFDRIISHQHPDHDT